MPPSRMVLVTFVPIFWFFGTWALIETAPKIARKKQEIESIRRAIDLAKELGLPKYNEYGIDRLKAAQSNLDSEEYSLSRLYIWCVSCVLLIAAGFVIFFWPTRR